MLGAVAVNKLARSQQDDPESTWMPWYAWLIITGLLVLICFLLLRYAAKNIQKAPFKVKEFERSDKEVLAFLLTYLLPFLASDKLEFSGEWMTGAYILIVIFLSISHADAVHFNPVMGLFGYHFYAVKDSAGVPHLLISKDTLRRPDREITVVRLTNCIYLQAG
jgi:hypothetical protein